MMRAFQVLVLFFAVAPISFAQDDSQNKSWSSASQQQDPSGAYNSTRTSESHTQVDGRAVDRTSVEAVGPDRRYVPYQEIEKESVKVDANTVRTIERTYATGPDGQKTLVQVREEESRKLADGGQSLVRTTSNPDANGSLQLVQREEQRSKQTSPDVRETKTTVLTPDINGGLSPTTQIEEREQKSGDGVVQFKKSTQLSDGTGHWNLAEVREGTDRLQSGDLHTIDERVLRPDSNGALAVVERTVKQQTESGSGEKIESVQTYSVNVPGVAGDSGLQLVRRQTTVVRNSLTGQSTTRQIEQPNPGAPGDSLQVTTEAIDIVRPGTSAADEKSTTLVRDSDGRLREVWVDFGKTDNPSALPQNPQPAAKPK